MVLLGDVCGSLAVVATPLIATLKLDQFGSTFSLNSAPWAAIALPGWIAMLGGLRFLRVTATEHYPLPAKVVPCGVSAVWSEVVHRD